MRSISSHGASAILGGVLTMVLMACGNVGAEVDSGDDVAADALTSVQRPFGALVNRVRNFESEGELARASDLVVIGTATPEQMVDRLSTAVGPLVSIRVEVDEVINGKVSDQSIWIFAEAKTLDDGTYWSPKLAAGTQYLLYLTRRDDFDGYAVTGFLAGLWERVPLADSGGRRAFGRVDPESPNLPIGLGIGSDGSMEPIEAD